MRRLIDSLPKGVRQLAKRLPGSRAISNRLFATPFGAGAAAGEMRPVVYLPTWLEWDYMRQRPHYILEALADRGHEIWFVSSAARARREIDSRIHLVPSLRPVPRSGVLIYTHFAPTRSMVERFDDAVVVYDLLDDLSIYDEDEVGLPERQRVRHHHSDFVERADVVIASNPLLLQRHLRERDDILLIENGVDASLFNPDGPVSSLADRPVVGYHGAISSWFDFAFVGEIVARRSDLSFVFVGPVDERVEGEVAELGAITNATFHSARPADEVASIVRSFDVGWIPFVVDEMTAGVTPLKMFEYMASGVPVVATPLPACDAHPKVATVSTPAGADSALDAALAITPEDRKSLREHGEAAAWSSRLAPLVSELDRRELRRV